MCLSQFLIYVLLVAASGITLNKNSMMAQSFLNPTAVVAAFQNSSPQEIEYMINLINTLIADNDDVAQTALDAFENANATFFAAQQAFHDAQMEHAKALANSDAAEAQVDIAKDAENDHYEAIEDAKDLLDEAQHEMDYVQMRYGVLEKQTLESITDQLHVMIGAVHIPGLLDQLHAIEAMVDGAKDTVEDAREELTIPLRDAKASLEHARDNYNDTMAEHARLQAEIIEFFENFVIQFAKDQDAEANLNAARANLDAAQSHLDAAQSHKNNAIAHSEGANGELTSLKQMLAELLSEKSGEEDLSDA